MSIKIYALDNILKGCFIIIDRFLQLLQTISMQATCFHYLGTQKQCMKNNIKDLVGQNRNLPSEDFQKLMDILVHRDHQVPLQLEDFVSDIKSAQIYKCSYRGSIHIVRNGHRPDGVQKYRC